MIASAVEHGSSVFIFNEKGVKVATVMRGSNPGDGLKGWTATSVSVKRGPLIYIYDERGTVQSVVPG